MSGTLTLFDPATLVPRELPERPIRVHGPCYVAEWDEKRLNTQRGHVFQVLRDGRRRTLRELGAEIEARFGKRHSETGLSARIRGLRGEGFPIPEPARRGDPTNGEFEYWMELDQ